MPITKKIPIDDIVVNYELQPRVTGLDHSHISDLVEAYEIDPESVDAIHVWKIAGRDGYLLSQGFHRIRAAQQANLDEIDCYVSEGHELDCRVDALCSNWDNGLKRTSADIERSIKELVRLRPELPKTKIAELLHVSYKTVTKYTKELDLPPAVSETGRVYERRKVKDEATDIVEPDKDELPKIPSTVIPTAKVLERSSTTPQSRPSPIEEEESDFDLGVSSSMEGVNFQSNNVPAQAWMPNAEDAFRVTNLFDSLSRKLIAITKEFESGVDQNSVMASRTNRESVIRDLKALTETLKVNIPDCVCPNCAGTGEVDGQECQRCDGYGFVDKTSADHMRKLWDRSSSKYLKLTEDSKWIVM